MSEFTPQELDFLSFVRRHTDEIDMEWAEVARGDLNVADIVLPLFAHLAADPGDANATVAAYSADFVSFVRARNGNVTTRMASLWQVALNSRHNMPENYFAGTFPTHSFNAQAYREGSTNLLLVNTGFERMMVEAARLLFAIHQNLAPKKVERWPEPSWWALRTQDELLDSFAELLASFIRSAEPDAFYLDEDLFPFEPDRELPAFAAGAAGQDFALAHELGHLALGHLDDGRQVRRLRSGLSVVGSNISDEHAADIFAGTLLFCQRQGAEEGLIDLLYGKYLGVGLFFDLDGVIAEIERIAFDLPDETGDQSHPPARCRECVMLQAIRRSIVSPTLFADRRTIGGTFRAIRDQLIARSLQRL